MLRWASCVLQTCHPFSVVLAPVFAPPAEGATRANHTLRRERAGENRWFTSRSCAVERRFLHRSDLLAPRRRSGREGGGEGSWTAGGSTGCVGGVHEKRPGRWPVGFVECCDGC